MVSFLRPFLFVALFAFFSGSAPAAIAPPAKVAPTDIHCADAYRILDWAQGHFGGLGRPEVQSPGFAKKALDQFLDKADPLHLLLTRADVEAFHAATAKTWKTTINSHQCSPFTRWIALRYPPALARLHRTVVDVSRKLTWPAATSPNAGALPELPSPDYETYAADEAELRARVETLAQEIAKQATEAMLAAYQNSRLQLVFDTVVRMATSPLVEEPHEMIAKTLLSTIDPYSTYFSRDEYDDFSHELSGRTSGIGVRVRRIENGLLIEQIIQDSPAGKSHALRAGDLIVEVNGVSLRNTSDSDSRRVLKGDEGSKVTLTLRRAGEAQRRRVQLKRRSFTFEDARIETKVVASDLTRQDSVAIVAVPSFYGKPTYGGENDADSRSSAEDLQVALAEALSAKKAPSAVILDLRDNPGGFLEEAVSMAGLFIGGKPVVTVVEPSGRRVLRDEVHTKPLYNGPLIVLVNHESASASEVLSGALQDHHRALIVGATATFGKGSVQRLFPVRATWFDPVFDQSSRVDGAVKITTSLFFSPAGHSPSKQGIAPNVVLKYGAGCEPSAAELAHDATKNVGFLIADTQSALSEAETRQLGNQAAVWNQKVRWVKERSDARKMCFAEREGSRRRRRVHKDLDPELREAVAIASDWTQTWYSEVAAQK